MVLVVVRLRASERSLKDGPCSGWIPSLDAINRLGHCERSHRKHKKAKAIHERSIDPNVNRGKPDALSVPTVARLSPKVPWPVPLDDLLHREGKNE